MTIWYGAQVQAKWPECVRAYKIPNSYSKEKSQGYDNPLDLDLEVGGRRVSDESFACLVADVVAEAVDTQRTPRPRVRVAVRGARAVNLACSGRQFTAIIIKHAFKASISYYANTGLIHIQQSKYLSIQGSAKRCPRLRESRLLAAYGREGRVHAT